MKRDVKEGLLGAVVGAAAVLIGEQLLKKAGAASASGNEFSADIARAKLQDALRRLEAKNKTAYQRLQERQRQSEDPGKFAGSLSKLVVAFDDNPETLLEMLEWAGMMEEQEFSAFLEGLSYEPFVYVLKRAGVYAKVIWEKLYSNSPDAPGILQKMDRGLNQQLGPFLERWGASVQVRQDARRQRMDSRRFVW